MSREALDISYFTAIGILDLKFTSESFVISALADWDTRFSQDNRGYYLKWRNGIF
jgi:hypothetical protein